MTSVLRLSLPPNLRTRRRKSDRISVVTTTLGKMIDTGAQGKDAMTNELIPTIAQPWYETWSEFADSGMWAELRESLNLFHDLRPDHPVWQVEASADELHSPSADPSQTTQSNES